MATLQRLPACEDVACVKRCGKPLRTVESCVRAGVLGGLAGAGELDAGTGRRMLARRGPPRGGVAALVHGEAVAVFRTHDDEVFALGNVDPVSRASVMSRGILGTRGDVPFVAGPL